MNVMEGEGSRPGELETTGQKEPTGFGWITDQTPRQSGLTEEFQTVSGNDSEPQRWEPPRGEASNQDAINREADRAVHRLTTVVDRRNFLKRLAAWGAGGVAVAVGADKVLGNRDHTNPITADNAEAAPNIPQVKIVDGEPEQNGGQESNGQVPENSQNEGSLSELRKKTWEFSLKTEVSREFLESANDVLAIPLFIENYQYTGERITAETNLKESAHTVDDIDCALSVCFIPTIRRELIQKRAALREAAGNKMYQLSEAEKKYCEEFDITPEIFALTQEVRAEMPAILKQIADDPTIELSDKDKLNPDQVLAKGIARLIMRETGGFKDIGDGDARDQLVGDIYFQDREVLDKYCEELRQKTELNYASNNIPGSLKGGEDASGGAIGIQFMPRNAVVFSHLMQEVGYDGNIFNIKQAIAMAYLYMESRGYEQNDPLNKKIKKYERWNPFTEEATDMAKADEGLMKIEKDGN